MINEKNYSIVDVGKFLIASFVGLFAFFIPVTIDGTNTILLDHIVTWIRNSLPTIIPIYATIILTIGAASPFITKKWNNNLVELVFSFFKVLGFIFALLFITGLGPSWLLAEDTGEFLYDKLVVPLSLLIPIGSAFLVLIVGYGLLEFIGVLFKPIMRPLWKTPGRSAVDAVASFVGSYSIGLLITNRVYKEGKYTLKESMIIATGFSTVSAPIIIVVAKLLDLMEIWNLYFWTALFTTFLVTAITVRLPPLSKKSDNYYVVDNPNVEPEIKKDYIKNAWKEGMYAAKNSKTLLYNLTSNLKDGFRMTLALLPTGMSFGLLGILASKYTPIFDIIGYVFYPLLALFQIPEPLLLGKALSLTIIEMIMPTLILTTAPLITKFILGVVTVSAIIFFAGSIPSMVATDIPFKLTDLVIIWFERVILSIIIVTPIAFIFL